MPRPMHQPVSRHPEERISGARAGSAARARLGTSDAVVAAWLPGSEGQGVADVLLGDHKPTGKLPVSWPRSMSQLPINVGDANYDPLFPFGFGLTY